MRCMGGSFRLEFMGDLTADIPFDATSAEMHYLESLDSIGAVAVTQSAAGGGVDGNFISGSFTLSFRKSQSLNNRLPVLIQ